MLLLILKKHFTENYNYNIQIFNNYYLKAKEQHGIKKNSYINLYKKIGLLFCIETNQILFLFLTGGYDD